MKKIPLIYLAVIMSTVILQNSLQVVDATELDDNARLFAYLDSGRNTTQVSVITATPEVTTVNATAITTTISATTASVSISTTGGTQDYYFEAIMVVIIAATLGIVAFIRKKKLDEGDKDTV